MQDYCYYSFQDNAYRRCLDTDSDKLDSKGCTSGSDEIYQMIPSSITTYYYWSVGEKISRTKNNSRDKKI